MQQLKEKLEKLEIEKKEWTQAKSSMEAAVAQVRSQVLTLHFLSDDMTERAVQREFSEFQEAVL